MDSPVRKTFNMTRIIIKTREMTFGMFDVGAPVRKYPKMTVEPYSHEFNCIMRAYQNTLENYPQFLAFTLLGGISFPKVSAICGLLWIISRIVYTRGHYSGDPEQKKYGAFGQFGMFILVILNIVQALQFLGVV